LRTSVDNSYAGASQAYDFQSIPLISKGFNIFDFLTSQSSRVKVNDFVRDGGQLEGVAGARYSVESNLLGTRLAVSTLLAQMGFRISRICSVVI
jgi:hypothetical protein